MSCCCRCDEGEALDPITSLFQPPRPLPRQAWCPKCASDDLHMSYALNEHQCSYNRKYGVFRPCEGVEGEHIEVHCRGCSFGWYEAPLDSLSDALVD